MARTKHAWRKVHGKGKLPKFVCSKTGAVMYKRKNKPAIYRYPKHKKGKK